MYINNNNKKSHIFLLGWKMFSYRTRIYLHALKVIRNLK